MLKNEFITELYYSYKAYQYIILIRVSSYCYFKIKETKIVENVANKIEKQKKFKKIAKNKQLKKIRTKFRKKEEREIK